MNNISICFLDTEFNATDYATQNDGIQEITEIGAVVFKSGKLIDKFSCYCQLKKGHRLTKRCKKITGITPEILKNKGIPFIQAMEELDAFLKKHGIEKVYAFGPADSFEMRTTAKLNNADASVYQTIKKIRNIYPIFEQRLSLHYAFSLFDICRICYIDHGADGRAHSAVNDAEDTGLAYYNMKAKKINKELLREINTHKYNVKVYRTNRSVKLATIKKPELVTDDFIIKLESIFKNAESAVDVSIITAVHDDMMRLIGRPDLETGEENL